MWFRSFNTCCLELTQGVSVEARHIGWSGICHILFDHNILSVCSIDTVLFSYHSHVSLCVRLCVNVLWFIKHWYCASGFTARLVAVTVVFLHMLSFIFFLLLSSLISCSTPFVPLPYLHIEFICHARIFYVNIPTGTFLTPQQNSIIIVDIQNHFKVKWKLRIVIHLLNWCSAF